MSSWIEKSTGGLYDPFNLGLPGSDANKEIKARPDYPYLSAEKLYGYANNYMDTNPYDPAAAYSGKLSAGMTATENRGQNKLNNFLDQGTPQVLTDASNYNSSVLNGGYDPRTSPYYASMKEQIMKDAQEANAALRHDSASSGMLHSDPRHDQERKLTENTSAQLASLLGSIYETERGRMGQAASLAPQLATLQYDLPLKQIGAASTYGAIPREVEQSSLDRLYSEWQRQEQGKALPLEILQGLSGKQYDEYDAQPYAPGQGAASDMTSTLMTMLPLLMASDKRLKSGIKYLGIFPVKGLELATWQWNDIAKSKGIDSINIGFIAQDVEKLYPDAVRKDEEGYLMIDYSKLPYDKEAA